MFRPVLKDPSLQSAFDKDGFVVVDLLSQEELSGLENVLSGLNEKKDDLTFNIDTNYKLSFFSTEPAFRQLVFDKIGTYCQSMADRFLDNYEPLIINMFDKEPGTGEVPIHQNWTFVDEAKAASVSVWIPLIDATHTNGTMEVVPKSHGVLSKFRSPSIPWVFENLRHEIRAKYMQAIDVKVGQAVVLDDSILHYTSQNDSDKVRSAIQLIMKPNDVPAIHYHLPKNDSDFLDVYEVNSEFFTRFNMNEAPDGVPKVDEVPFSQGYLSEQDLLERISGK